MKDTSNSPDRDKVNILLVDDQPAKLLSYELVLHELGHNLLKANSATDALRLLLDNQVAVILIDVCMPDLDGFELAQMVRDHPRFADIAIIFVSAINVTEMDSLRGYELGGVDYVSVPVVPNILRAKVRVFVDLYIKTRALARINSELEQRVAERTAELEAAIARQELLAHEVDHRARNALAVIQSIVALTPADDSLYFADAVRGRIHAMATAHNLLSESRWRGADLLSLVREELAPYDQSSVKIAGEAVSIAPSIAQSLALALHELATNAAKYGALKNSEGTLSVDWRLNDEHLELKWCEEGGADVNPPSRAGFGSKVIETSITGQLRGQIEREWTTNGLVCAIRIPSEHFLAPEPNSRSSEDQRHHRPTNRQIIRGRSILVLEDEALVAMMTCRIIEELGARAIGPFGKMEEAREALSEGLDAAVLDINLDGELVYDLAAEIRNRGKPIIFVTGYHVGAIVQDFSDVPVLTKPIEPEDLAAALAEALAK
ncbi:response regulator [Methylocystis suflitae]|uniref:response regulator n=1 Tax=Methylocystis suflitae TaxID=2951405 RepID=UPI002108A519|nr:response regulator [Methylocystis suflitae]MCQ4190745.1 response regulator [Methylocystis suflitae]